MTASRLDTAALRKAIPDVAAAFTRTTTTRRFCVAYIIQPPRQERCITAHSAPRGDRDYYNPSPSKYQYRGGKSMKKTPTKQEWEDIIRPLLATAYKPSVRRKLCRMHCQRQ